MIAEDCEGPHKGPAARVQLGRGHVDLYEESTFENGKGEAEFEPLEVHGIHEEEGLPRVRLIINAHGDPFPAR